MSLVWACFKVPLGLKHLICRASCESSDANLTEEACMRPFLLTILPCCTARLAENVSEVTSSSGGPACPSDGDSSMAAAIRPDHFPALAKCSTSHEKPPAANCPEDIRIPEAQHPSDEGEEEDDAAEDLEKVDFDPFLFIKRLPKLSDVVPPFRPHLLPKQTRRCHQKTLVLDLDGKPSGRHSIGLYVNSFSVHGLGLLSLSLRAVISPLYVPSCLSFWPQKRSSTQPWTSAMRQTSPSLWTSTITSTRST